MVGTAVGHLLREAGHHIIAVCDKSPAALERALPYTGGNAFAESAKAVREADTILITTPDDMISQASKKIADPHLVKGKFVFHMSGAGGLDLLADVKESGAFTACIHPIQSFSSIDSAISNLPGSVFGITADKEAEKHARVIVRDLHGIPTIIAPEQKPLYHAAACLASNYLVALLHVVESFYEAIGLNAENAQKAYLPLVYGTLKNIQNSGSIKALTGPIARGDVSTIKKHMHVIAESQPQYASLYSEMGLIAVKIAQQKGTLPPRQAKIITDILKGVNQNEYANKKQS